MSGFPRGGGAGAVASVFGRVGGVVATAGDYTAAQVTNAADKSAAGAQTFTAELAAPDVKVSGLTGAANPARLVGATVAGPPVAGTFAVDDLVVDQAGKEYVCTAAGTPGTWALVGPGGLVKANQDADQSAVNTVVNTLMVSLAIPTGVATSDRLHLWAVGEQFNNSGVAATYTFQLLVGATVITTSNALSMPNTAVVHPWLADIWLAVLNPSNSQRIGGIMVMGTNATGAFGGSDNTAPIYGISAEDLTAGKNVQIKCQMGAANANTLITCHGSQLLWVPKG